MTTPPMFAGNTRNLNYTVKNRAGAAVNLTGASIAWKLSTNRDGDALISKSTSSGITITSAVAGQFKVALAPADTSALAGLYWHQATITDASGNVVTVMQDQIQINPIIN